MFSILDEESIIVVDSDDSKEFISQIIKDKSSVLSRTISSIDMISLTFKSFKEKKFEDIAYIEPMYIKKTICKLGNYFRIQVPSLRQLKDLYRLQV